MRRDLWGGGLRMEVELPVVEGSRGGKWSKEER